MCEYNFGGFYYETQFLNQLYTKGRLSAARLKITRTAKGRNRHLGQTAFTVYRAAPQNPLY